MYQHIRNLAILIGVLLPSLSLADGSSVFIRQIGDGNVVSVRDTGNDNDVSVVQSSRFLGASLGQSLLEGGWRAVDALVPAAQKKQQLDALDDTARAAILSASQSALGGLGGNGNTATVEIGGDGSTANVFQTGSNNDATLKVSGNGSKGTIWQNGSDNEAGLAVTSDGTSALYTQSGNGLTSSSLSGLPAGASTSNGMVTVHAPGNSVMVLQQMN